MRILTSLLTVSISALGHGYDVNPWSPPRPTDSRPPCPGLNTLANHGYLPHDGHNLTIQHFADAVHAAFNWDPTYGSVPAIGAWALLGLNPALNTTVDLSDLNAANRTEHRASLTRDDAEAGDASTLNPARLRAFLDDSTTDAITVRSVARSRLRVQEEPGAPFLTETQAATARQEVSLLLMLMSIVPVPEAGGAGSGSGSNAPDHGVLRVPKERVSTWLAEERLPVELGWRPSGRVLVLSDVFGVADAVEQDMNSASVGR